MRNPKDMHWRGQRLAAVLFDLDGTLLDTAADIALALNRTMAEYDCEPLPEYDVRRMVGRGCARWRVLPTNHARLPAALRGCLVPADWFDVLVGGDPGARHKPDPQPLVFA